MLGPNLIEASGNYIEGWPGDWYQDNEGSTSTVLAITRKIQRNFVRGTAKGVSTHADGLQITALTKVDGLEIDHNVILMPKTPPPGSGGLTAPLNISIENGDWSVPTSINNNLLTGGSYNIYNVLNGGRNQTAAITLGERMFIGDAENGIVYPVSQLGPLTKIDALRDYRTNLPQPFSNNNGVTTTTVYAVP